MWPEVTIFGYTIALYGVWILLGVLVGTGVGILLGKRSQLNIEDIIFAFTYGILGAIIGGKILYLIVELPWIIENFSLILTNKELMLALMSGGFVFYGGLIGGLIGVYLYCKMYKLAMAPIFSILIVVIPLVHAFGRLGCFSAGCCYGIHYSGIGSIIFTKSTVAPNGVPLLPIQLIESLGNMVIFIILLTRYKKGSSCKKLITIYSLFYSLMRFILEFFRGDKIRGITMGLSTSQWISIIIIIGLFIWNKNKSD